MSKLVAGEVIQPPSPIPSNNVHQDPHANGGNPCGYDSFLHATICTKNGHSVRHHVSSTPLHSTPTKVLQNYNNRNVRIRHKTHDPQGIITTNTSLTASPQVQGYSKLNSSVPAPIHPKLNTTALSQLNPQLTPEQKFSRTINHVEKWLNEREQVLIKTNNTEPKKVLTPEMEARTNNIGKDEKNLDNLINTKVFCEKIKTTEKFTEKFAADSPAKKTFNKEVLLRPRKAKSHRSNGVVSASAAVPLESDPKSQALVEFGAIPLTGNRSECENLLRASCTDESSCSQVEGETSTSSAVQHRYVHEHIHHHYHHFENSTDIV